MGHFGYAAVLGRVAEGLRRARCRRRGRVWMGWLRCWLPWLVTETVTPFTVVLAPGTRGHLNVQVRSASQFAASSFSLLLKLGASEASAASRRLRPQEHR